MPVEILTKDEFNAFKAELFQKLDLIIMPPAQKGNDMVPIKEAVTELGTTRNTFKTYGIPIHHPPGHPRKQFCYRKDLEAYKAKAVIVSVSTSAWH